MLKCYHVMTFNFYSKYIHLTTFYLYNSYSEILIRAAERNVLVFFVNILLESHDIAPLSDEIAASKRAASRFLTFFCLLRVSIRYLDNMMNIRMFNNNIQPVLFYWPNYNRMITTRLTPNYLYNCFGHFLNSLFNFRL